MAHWHGPAGTVVRATVVSPLRACTLALRRRILRAMDQYPVELILVRHLASRLAIPVFVVDATGDLVFFNEPAEGVLGRRYDEIRIMGLAEWTTAFVPSAGGHRLDPDDLPLVIALRQSIPAHRRFDIVGADGFTRSIEVTAFPILAPSDRLIGAVAMFWQTDRA
jgi:PAS domain-containing protein